MNFTDHLICLSLLQSVIQQNVPCFQKMLNQLVHMSQHTCKIFYKNKILAYQSNHCYVGGTSILKLHDPSQKSGCIILIYNGSHWFGVDVTVVKILHSLRKDRCKILPEFITATITLISCTYKFGYQEDKSLVSVVMKKKSSDSSIYNT